MADGLVFSKWLHTLPLPTERVVGRLLLLVVVWPPTRTLDVSPQATNRWGTVLFVPPATSALFKQHETLLDCFVSDTYCQPIHMRDHVQIYLYQNCNSVSCIFETINYADMTLNGLPKWSHRWTRTHYWNLERKYLMNFNCHTHLLVVTCIVTLILMSLSKKRLKFFKMWGWKWCVATVKRLVPPW